MRNCLEIQFVTTYLHFIDYWLEKSDKVYLRSRCRDGKVSKYYAIKTADGKRYYRSITSPEAPMLEKQMLLTKFFLEAKADFLNNPKWKTAVRASAGNISELPWTPPQMPLCFDKLSAERFDKLHPANEPVTSHGLRHGNTILRSKAEDMIASIYDELHLPYVYEPRVQLLNYEAKPDFGVLLPFCGSFYFHEHLGMGDDDVYLARSSTKMNEYSKVGVYQGRNLLVTTESSDMPASYDELRNSILSFIVKYTI